MATATETEVDQLLEELLRKKEPEREEALPDEEIDLSKIPQRKPPKDGLCRRCGQDKPINRAMLCYPCWVKSNLEESGWRQGLPHPEWCRCEGLPEHPRRALGN